MKLALVYFVGNKEVVYGFTQLEYWLLIETCDRFDSQGIEYRVEVW